MIVNAAAFLGAAAMMNAQTTVERRAEIRGGGGRSGGECVVEVLVDGPSEVVVQGDHGLLRNFGSGEAAWRRFECTSAMPENPGNFEFRGLGGRIGQQLAKGPQDGGRAVVRIPDPGGVPAPYRFQLVWEDRGAAISSNPERFTQQDAMKVCQDRVREEAMQRFQGGSLDFRTTAETGSFRPDWISGKLEVRGEGRDDWYKFSCSMNYAERRVVKTEIEPMEPPRDRR